MKKVLIIGFVLIILLGGIPLAVLGYLNYLVAREKSPYEEARTFTVKEGWGVTRIGNELRDAGFIRTPFYFQYTVWREGIEDNLQAGEYAIPPHASVNDIARLFARGEVIPGMLITFPEGLTLREIEKKLSQNSFVVPLSTYTVSDFTARHPFLSRFPQRASLEGFLFPDTYRFDSKLSNEAIVGKFLANFEKRFSALNTGTIQNRQMPKDTTPYDVLIMASMVEEEVRSDEDRHIVAGVLWKRLRLGMPLQVDATVLYAKGEMREALTPAERRLTKADLAINSPYNTYRVKGLPPGPIANPGASSLRAAWEPQESLYFYYLSTPDGETIFSKTLDEHNAAVAKYLR